MLVFCSYSHHDEKHRRALEMHLAGMRHQGIIDKVWHDREIPPGQDWKKEIDAKLEIADVIILLVSPHFIASEYCYSVEMARALDRHRQGEALVIPIIIRSCDWGATPLSAIQLLPQDGRPLTEWPNRDRAWTRVVSEIRRLLVAFKENKLPESPFSSEKTRSTGKKSNPVERSQPSSQPSLIRQSQRKRRSGSLRLNGKQRFLIASNTAGKKRISVVSSLTDSLKRWSPSTKISPIYQLELKGQTLSEESLDDHQFILFLGPLSPARILEWWCEDCVVWITVGLFNVMVQAKTATRINRILTWAKNNSIRFELWRLEDGTIKKTTFSSNLAESNSWQAEIVKISRLSLSPDLQRLVQDYCSIMASALSKAATASPEMFQDLLTVNAFIKNLLKEHSKNNAYCTKVLSEINSSLAHLSSQALSGISPLSENQSEPQLHSLLGVGVATVAFSRLRSFIESTLGRARIAERLTVAGRQPAKNHPRLETMSSEDEFWFRDHLAAINIEATDYQAIPLVPYFAGYGTFKGSALTIRAPFNVISSCNSLRWSLLPVSHEISHLVVRTALTVIFPDLANRKALDQSLKMLAPAYSPRTLMEEIQRYFLLTVLQLDSLSTSRHEMTVNAEDMSNILRKWHQEIEEIMVHVFDYLYFYGQDAEMYVKVQLINADEKPIENRVRHYFLRVLCALMSSHLRRGAIAEEVCITQLQQIIKILSEDGALNMVFHRAGMNLSDDHELKMNLIAYKPIIRIVRTFLYSEMIATQLRQEFELNGGKASRGGYSLIPELFEFDKLSNPLRFLWHYSEDIKPSAVRSSWMLNTLAFNSSYDE